MAPNTQPPLQDRGNEVPSAFDLTTHLQLLHSFWELKQNICNRDGLFGIQNGSGTPEQVQEKRWAVYVARAVDRFTAWHAAYIEECNATPLTLKAMQKDFAFKTDGFYKHSELNVPPLDVLMVLHSYMLNPRLFLDDCLRKGIPGFHYASIPWDTLASCFDNDTREYRPQEAAETAFQQRCGLAWENLHDPDVKDIVCPTCAKTYQVNWTSWTDHKSPGNGYADNEFHLVCPQCNLLISHDYLRAHKFWQDLDLLMKEDVPMWGTILTAGGLPDPLHHSSTRNTSDPRASANEYVIPYFVCSILMRARYLKRTREDEVPYAKVSRQPPTLDSQPARSYVNTIRAELQKHSPFVSTLPFDKTYLGVLMANYSNNASPWAVDLIGAVIRQGAFVDNMVKLNWLHSPNRETLLRDLGRKYSRFFEVIAANPNQLIVPTLDIDLAWHTHQLSPKAYYQYSVGKTGIFIDHKDCITEQELSKAFEQSSKLYQDLFGEPYSICACWYCESIRASHTSTGMFKKSATTPASDPLRSAPTSPQVSPHISAHNAVLSGDNTSTFHWNLIQNYDRAAQLAKKAGRQIGSLPSEFQRQGDRPAPIFAGSHRSRHRSSSQVPYSALSCESTYYPSNPAGRVDPIQQAPPRQPATIVPDESGVWSDVGAIAWNHLRNSRHRHHGYFGGGFAGAVGGFAGGGGC